MSEFVFEITEDTVALKTKSDETGEINFPAQPSADLSVCAHPDSDRGLKSGDCVVAMVTLFLHVVTAISVKSIAHTSV